MPVGAHYPQRAWLSQLHIPKLKVVPRQPRHMPDWQVAKPTGSGKTWPMLWEQCDTAEAGDKEDKKNLRQDRLKATVPRSGLPNGTLDAPHSQVGGLGRFFILFST